MGDSEDVGLAELNNICPYFTMFPLSFPAGVLADGRRGQTVLDPFCGRGTSLLAARMRGMAAIGIDASPVAAAIAAVKIVKTKPRDVIAAANRILSTRRQPETPQGEFWKRAFHPLALRQICLLREALLNDCETPARIALRATMLGALHGPRRKFEPWYFSNQMPRTFASKPAYSVTYWKKHRQSPPKVNVRAILAKRAEKYFASASAVADGTVINADSRTCNLHELKPNAKWVVTSPPYYGMRSYSADQWLREWFLGGEPKVSYKHSMALSHQSPQQFSHDLALVWKNMASYCSKGATMVVRFGGINDRKENPAPIIRKSFDYAASAGWQYQGSRSAGVPQPGRRQASQFARTLNTYIDERDYTLTLAA